MALDWINRAMSLDGQMGPLSPLRQRCHRNVAGFYSDFEAHALAAGHYRTALAIDEARDPVTTPRRFRHCTSLAICLEKLGMLDSAEVYYQRAIAIATELNQPLYMSSAYNNYGMSMQAQGKVATALAHYRHAQALLRLDQPDALQFLLSVRDNIGEALLAMGQPAAAREQFALNFADHARMPWDQMHVQSGINLVRADLAQGALAQARQRMDSVAVFFRGCSAEVRRRYTKPFFLAEIQLCQAEGRWREASALQARLQVMEDSLRVVLLDRKVGTLASMLADKTADFRSQLALSEAAAESAAARSRTQALLFVSVAALALLLLLFWVVQNRRRMERISAQGAQDLLQRDLMALNLENQALQNAQLSQQLEMKQRDITDYALVYAQRRKLMEEMLETLREVKRNPQPEKGLGNLITDLKAKLDGEGKLHLESRHIDTVNHAFFDALKQRFPRLAPGELELCGMIRLGYTAKEIATMRNIAPGSVRIAKTRLKKKMGLGVDEDLDGFLGNVG